MCEQASDPNSNKGKRGHQLQSTSSDDAVHVAILTEALAAGLIAMNDQNKNYSGAESNRPT